MLRCGSRRLTAAVGQKPLFAHRFFGSIAETPSATAAWKRSCYQQVDFTIPASATAFEAVHKLSAFDIGCLVTTDEQGRIAGILSERDVVRKVALLDRPATEVKVSEIHTGAAKLVTASTDDSIQDCMNKMIMHDIRHLPLVSDEQPKEHQQVVGMLSIKDCAKALVAEKDSHIEMLSNLAMGKTGTFVVD